MASCKVCLTALLPDGTCRYKCPPELRRSVVHHAQVVARERIAAAETKARSMRITTEEKRRMRKAVTKIDPATGEFSRRMWARKGGGK